FPESIVVRFPLADLVTGKVTTADVIALDESGSPRVAQGITDVAYWATHGSDTSRLRIYSWPEPSKSAQQTIANIDPWVDPDKNARSTVGPQKMPWLNRLDGRITAAWAAGDQIGFAWSASQANGYPSPHIRVAILSTQDLKTVKAQPHIWSDQYALAY